MTIGLNNGLLLIISSIANLWPSQIYIQSTRRLETGSAGPYAVLVISIIMIS